MSAERYEPTSRDYERQAEATRHRLADTLDELHDRLTPGHVLDEVLSYARGGGAGFMRALTNAARENPIPTLLIGAGCAMFLAEKTGMTQRLSGGNGSARGYNGDADATVDAATSAGRSVRSAAQQSLGAVSDRAAALAAGAKNTAASVGGAVSGAAASVRDNVSGAAAAVGDTAASVGNRMSDAASRLGDAAADTAQSVRQSVQDGTARVGDMVDQVKDGAARAGDTAQEYSAAALDAGRQFKDMAASLFKEQPLLAAALGVAVGAVIAAALPKTEMEDELMGEASDAVKGTLGEVASDHYEKAKTAAATVAGHAMDKAKDEGLSPAAAADAVRAAGEKVKRVATEALGSAASALDQTAGNQKRS